jgi:hypothetical protein
MAARKANGFFVVQVRSPNIVLGGKEISPFLRAAKQLAGKSKAEDLPSSCDSLEPATRRPAPEPFLNVGCAPPPVKLLYQRTI